MALEVTTEQFYGELAQALGNDTAPAFDAEPSTPWKKAVYVASTVGFGAAVYHGYKRSGGAFWPTFGWGVFGALLPVIAVPVALAQGFGERSR